MTKTRRRFKQTMPLAERLRRFAEDVKSRADRLPQGDEKSAMLRKVNDAQRAMAFDELLTRSA